MFEVIDRVKPGLRKLIAALRETYPYASYEGPYALRLTGVSVAGEKE